MSASLFKGRSYIIEAGAVHLTLSFTLYYYGQFFFLLLFQLPFLLFIVDVKQKILKNLLFFSYLFFLNYASLLIFSFESYFIYFTALAIFIYFIHDQKITFNNKELLGFVIWAFVSIVAVECFQEEIFDLYIYIDINDKQNYFTFESAAILTLMHFFMLFFVLNRKDKETILDKSPIWDIIEKNN